MVRAALAAAYFAASSLAHGWDILNLSQWGATADRGWSPPPAEARGSPSSPGRAFWFRPQSGREANWTREPPPDKPESPWWVQVWLSMLFQAAENGLYYCGTLCASIGLAARWSYWLVTGTVVVFLVQLAAWTFTWVIHPMLTHSRALWRYCRGTGTWNDVACLQGRKPFLPTWKGPHTGRPWTAQYVQKEVRGRGAGQKPYDLDRWGGGGTPPP